MSDETNAERLRRVRAEAVKRGLCYVCRCRWPRPGVRTCDTCLQRTRDAQRTSPAMIASRARAKKRYYERRTEARKAAGLCIHCGRRPSEAAYVGCSVCLDRIANSTKKASPDGRCCTVCGSPNHFAQRHRRPGVLP